MKLGSCSCSRLPFPQSALFSSRGRCGARVSWGHSPSTSGSHWPTVRSRQLLWFACNPPARNDFGSLRRKLRLDLWQGEYPSAAAARDAGSRTNSLTHYQHRSGDLVLGELPYRAGEPARLRNSFCPPIETGTARARRRITMRRQRDCPSRQQPCTRGRKQVLARRHRSRFCGKPMVHGADTTGLGNIRNCAEIYPLRYNVSARELLCFRSSSPAKVKNC